MMGKGDHYVADVSSLAKVGQQHVLVLLDRNHLSRTGINTIKRQATDPTVGFWNQQMGLMRKTTTNDLQDPNPTHKPLQSRFPGFWYA
jgi:hypothetical protein